MALYILKNERVLKDQLSTPMEVGSEVIIEDPLEHLSSVPTIPVPTTNTQQTIRVSSPVGGPSNNHQSPPLRLSPTPSTRSRQVRARRRGLTPFDRAVREYVVIEQHRLQRDQLCDAIAQQRVEVQSRRLAVEEKLLKVQENILSCLLKISDSLTEK